MEPFDGYPDWLRDNPRCLGGGNCRTEYGLRLQQITGQRSCVYCGLSLADTYEHWLLLSVEHVLPQQTMSRGPEWKQWVDNVYNLAICCQPCNTLLNGFRLAPEVGAPTTYDGFFALRDAFFSEKKAYVQKWHEAQRRIFDTKPWDRPLDPSTLPRY
jgi:hypothetical protein